MTAIFLMAPASEWWGKLKTALADHEGLKWFECADSRLFTIVFNHEKSGILVCCPTERLQLAAQANVVRTNRAQILAGKLKTVVIVPPSLLSGQFRATELIQLGFNEVIPGNSSDSFAAHKLSALLIRPPVPSAVNTVPLNSLDPLEKMKDRMRKTAEKLKNLIPPELLSESLKKLDSLSHEQKNNAEAYDKIVQERFSVSPEKVTWDPDKAEESLNWILPFSFFSSELVQKKAVEKVRAKNPDWSWYEIQQFGFQFCRRLVHFFEVEQTELWTYDAEKKVWKYVANSISTDAKPGFESYMINISDKPSYLPDLSASLPVMNALTGKMCGVLIIKGAPVQQIELEILSQVTQFARSIVLTKAL